MSEDRIAVEGGSLEEALHNANEELDAEGEHQIEYEYDRAHFRSGANTVRIFAWKKDPSMLEAVRFAHDFVSGYLESFGVDGGAVRVHEGTEKIVLAVSAPGKTGNLLIGREGKNLDALQHILTNAMVHHGHDIKAVIDVEEYRSRREDRVREQARYAIRDVLSSREPVSIGPMNSYERRIVHMEVMKHGGLQSHSIGQGKMKTLEISPA